MKLIPRTCLPQVLEIPEAGDWHLVGPTEDVDFENSWTNYGGTTQAVAYRLNIQDEPEVIGACKSGTVGAAVFTLPAAYRRDKNISYPIACEGGAGLLVIQADGSVIITDGSDVLSFIG